MRGIMDGIITTKALISDIHGGSNADATKSMNNRLNSVREDQIRLCLALIEGEVY
jgi:hypothetical protein